jgi:hypothetical protein
LGGHPELDDATGSSRDGRRVAGLRAGRLQLIVGVRSAFMTARSLLLCTVWPVAAPLLTACADSPLAPNTDVGLRVWATVSPASVSVRDSAAAALRIRIHVHNPSNHVIRVVSGGPPYTFTGDPSQSRGLWGSFRIACDRSPLNCGPNTDWFGDSVYVFAPRTTEYSEAVITLRAWKHDGWPLLPGHYIVRAWFNGREGESAPLLLRP